MIYLERYLTQFLKSNIYNHKNKVKLNKKKKMTPMQRVLEALQQLDKQFPQPAKPSDKPTYNEGAAFVINELLQQVETEVENEKELIINSCFYGKINPGNYNDNLEYYNGL
jgi:hypothetical protein